MDALAASYPGSLVKLEGSLEREFEDRLADSSKVAFRVAYSVLRQREDAEDVAQEAFVRAYRRFGTLRDRTRFRAWLVKIVWRLALDRQRANRRRENRELAAPEPSAEPTVETLAVSRERQEHVWRAVDALPRKQREVVVLASIEGQDLRAVAEMLGLPEGTVKSRLHAARRTLLENLRWIASDSNRR